MNGPGAPSQFLAQARVARRQLQRAELQTARAQLQIPVTLLVGLIHPGKKTVQALQQLRRRCGDTAAQLTQFLQQGGQLLRLQTQHPLDLACKELVHGAR